MCASWPGTEARSLQQQGFQFLRASTGCNHAPRHPGSQHPERPLVAWIPKRSHHPERDRLVSPERLDSECDPSRLGVKTLKPRRQVKYAHRPCRPHRGTGRLPTPITGLPDSEVAADDSGRLNWACFNHTTTDIVVQRFSP